MSLGLNILLIFVFLVIGSVFSGTELALVSLRGSQIEQMEQEDARGAKVAKIARDPNTFLSTVQIGVTLSGFLSASFGESSISPFIVPVVKSWGVPANIAAPLTTIVLTLIISYCSIVISEMVPKRIAMQRTEQIARAVVPAIDAFAAVCRRKLDDLSIGQNFIGCGAKNVGRPLGREAALEAVGEKKDFHIKELSAVWRMFIRMRSGRLGSDTAGLDGERSKNQLFSGASLLCAL